MKKTICLLLLLVAAVTPAVAEYSRTQELNVGNYILHLPLDFQKSPIVVSPVVTNFFKNGSSVDMEQITIQINENDPDAAYSTPGEAMSILKKTMDSESECWFEQADECIAFVSVSNVQYSTEVYAKVINGKDSLDIFVVSWSRDRAVEICKELLSEIDAKEFRQP